jgi:hypothetical protein
MGVMLAVVPAEGVAAALDQPSLRHEGRTMKIRFWSTSLLTAIGD